MKKAMSYIKISELVLKEHSSLYDLISEMTITKGGLDVLNSNFVQIFEINNYNGFSGYNYWIDNEMVGQLHISSLRNGEYAVYKRVFFEEELSEYYSYYDKDGNHSYTSEVFNQSFELYENIEMDPSNPMVNHLYNVLNLQYALTETGESNSLRINTLEVLLNKLLKDKKTCLSTSKYRKDEAYQQITNQILYLESDKVLRWTERQNIFDKLLEKRSQVIKTKKRAHGYNWLAYVLPFFFSNIILTLALIKKRPVNNLRGLFYKHTIGKIIWFLSTVKENLGYSIALAIYGPFTFYFITQPMNPHAMWVVGEVREVYIDTTKSIEGLFKFKESAKEIQVQDEVSTKLAANTKQNWDTRMSQFKAMNIAYESNLLFAERMGRLEQIETQLNFPLAVESAWNEITRYQRAVNGTLSYVQTLDNDYKTFLNKELSRALDAQVYLWERMSQFFIDYPYILVDQQMEQSEKNAYTGRAFVFMQKMTDTLGQIKSLNKPQTHEMVSKLAKFYKESKIHGDSTLDTLSKNSKLFASNDIYNTDKFRSYMKRHWEILMLQQNKKQEASSFGMQAYSASIKNAIYTIQSLYSTKRDDHMVLSYKFNLQNQNTQDTMPYLENSEMVEELLHFITFDYVSIKKEFSESLENDKEAELREKLISNIKSYASERDYLLNKNRKVFAKTVTETK